MVYQIPEILYEILDRMGTTTFEHDGSVYYRNDGEYQYISIVSPDHSIDVVYKFKNRQLVEIADDILIEEAQ